MSYELEFDITNLLGELLRNPRIPINRNTNATATVSNNAPSNANHSATPNASINANHTANRNGSDQQSNDIVTMIQRNQNTVDELIYRYNSQMGRYQQNMERLIQLVHSNQTHIQQLQNPTPQPTYAFSNSRRNAVREDANIIRTMLNNPLYRMDTTLLYTYLYPNIQQTNAATTMSAEQRANAIQTIRYDSNVMRDSVCPISLVSFTHGENVSQIRHCGHIFKPDSLNHWFSNYSTCCPVCRYDIRTYTNTGNTEPRQQTSVNNNREEDEDEGNTDSEDE